MGSSAFRALLLCGLGCWSAAGQNDFAYPADMPPPPEMWIEGFASRLHVQGIQAYETPIQVWQTWRLDQIMWNCIARYHPSALDAITLAAPSVRAPAEFHNSEARALCMIHAVNKLVPELVPNSVEIISSWLEELGLDASIMSDQEAQTRVDDGEVNPRVLGSHAAAQMLLNMQTDGWNHLGQVKTVTSSIFQWKLRSPNRPVTPCTANCRPFSDTTGYIPQNTPWEYTVPGAWQPLIESDDNGFFFSQEHVTPHIGTTVHPVVISSRDYRLRTLDDPEYDYDVEADLAIQRVAELTDFQKVMIEFMDNKINIAGGLITRVREEYSLSLEAQVYYHYGYTSTEIDSVLLSWKEKVAHDLVRPTTIVQLRGEETVTSFAGEEGHFASDWVPYIRIMPHAEYPSGSGCICTVVHQYVDAFAQDSFGIDSYSTTWEFAAGSSNVQPGVVPAEDITVTFETMEELRDICGESRLWGGMHFTASVPDSYDLCDGVGTEGLALVKKLLTEEATFDSLLDESLGIILFSG